MPRRYDGRRILSVLIGLTPEFDSDCSHQCKQLATRIARLEVVVRRARASMDFTAHEDDEGGREDGQQHGGSRSILVGLDPEFDSGCSKERKQLAARIARLKVVV